MFDMINLMGFLCVRFHCYRICTFNREYIEDNVNSAVVSYASLFQSVHHLSLLWFYFVVHSIYREGSILIILFVHATDKLHFLDGVMY